MAFSSVERLLETSSGMPLWQAVQEEDLRDRGDSPERSWSRMEALWRAMGEAVADYDPGRRSRRSYWVRP